MLVLVWENGLLSPANRRLHGIARANSWHLDMVLPSPIKRRRPVLSATISGVSSPHAEFPKSVLGSIGFVKAFNAFHY
jgi:hypothetical protein